MFSVLKPSPTQSIALTSTMISVTFTYFFLQRSSALFGRSALSPVSVSVSYGLSFTSAFFFSLGSVTVSLHGVSSPLAISPSLWRAWDSIGHVKLDNANRFSMAI